MSFNQHKKALIDQGFSITECVFSNEEIQRLLLLIETSEKEYAIRKLTTKKPEILDVIFGNEKFKKLYELTCDQKYFLSKAIFFNKPSKSNWFVSMHQDLSISVARRIEEIGYTNWTNKNGQLGVIPPNNVLDNTITFRIHLDKTDETNGALSVIPKTHSKGIIRVDESFDKNSLGNEELCIVEKGGVMLMKPLLLHASSKSVSTYDRRVIHLEFCNQEIPMGWLEKKKVS
ncbi:phytanoyl-CoA dioxygenase family protein [uncultured Tenacibaculum sp.]|uniref:phytanoyl-CoA dioxygenase family protein n=1 Tax=uncultured Tenacibaculum sp. TaxID=174713 RepID=UPI00263494A5|nr:phytanoyl-CoA dioxygenase family protein [uncultured Tenacibaculum sp.]